MHLETHVRTWCAAIPLHCVLLYSAIALSQKLFETGHTYIYTFFFVLRITSQNSDLSSWDMLYIYSYADSLSHINTYTKQNMTSRWYNISYCSQPTHFYLLLSIHSTQLPPTGHTYMKWPKWWLWIPRKINNKASLYITWSNGSYHFIFSHSSRFTLFFLNCAITVLFNL
jgi:hypothetical protein